MCWNEEQPGNETLPDGTPGFDPFVGECYEYEARFCCQKAEGEITNKKLTIVLNAILKNHYCQ